MIRRAFWFTGALFIYNFGDFSSSDPGPANQVLGRFPLGNKAQVYDNPNDPGLLPRLARSQKKNKEFDDFLENLDVHSG